MKTAILFFLIINTAFCISANPLTDPAIPDGEKITYKVTKEDEVSWTTMEIRQESNDAGNYYVIHTQSPEEESDVYIRNYGLIPFKSYTVKKQNGTEMTEEININRMPTYGPESIAVIGLPDLIHVLRGFPFEKDMELDLVFIGQEGSDEFFSMKIVYEKEEEIEVNGKIYKVHKLRLKPVLSGIMKLAGGLFPKTYLWYSVEKPHYLIKYTGSAGASSDEQTIEISSYSVSGR